MDSAANRVEMAEEEQLEPLVITEDGDTSEGEATTGDEEESALQKKEEPSGEDESNEAVASKMHLEERSSGQNTEDKGQNVDNSESEEKSHQALIKDNSSQAEEEETVVTEGVELKRLNSSKLQPNGAEKQGEDAKKVSKFCFYPAGGGPQSEAHVLLPVRFHSARE